MELPTIKRRQSGFTLIELLIVIAIIAILISIGLASYSRVQKSARDSQRRADLHNVAAALEQFYGDYNIYPYSAGAVAGKIVIYTAYPTSVATSDCTGAAAATLPAESATPLSWGDAAYPFACGGKTYLSQLPKEPLPSGKQYYYRSCLSNQSYVLFTHLEGSTGTLPTPPCPIPALYNYWVSSQ